MAGRSGKLVSTRSTHLAETLKDGPPQQSRFLKVEQSNSSVIYDDKIYLKLFRKLEEGINPDLELTKQLSENCGFVYVPTYLGDIQYVAPGQEPASLVMIQSFTSNEQDGWTQTLSAVSRYFDRVLEDPQIKPAPALGLWEEIPEPFLGIIEGVHLDRSLAGSTNRRDAPGSCAGHCFAQFRSGAFFSAAPAFRVPVHSK